MYDPDMARKAAEDDDEYYRERAALIDARVEHLVVFEGGATYPCSCPVGELHPVITERV